jgi:putative transposase
MHESGRDVTDLCRENNIHRSTIYTWKKKYGGLEVQELIRLKELEKENRRLK